MLTFVPPWPGLRCEIGVAPVSSASPDVGPSYDNDEPTCVRDRDQAREGSILLKRVLTFLRFTQKNKYGNVRK